MPTVRIEPKTKIWLKFSGVKFRLPVNPEELTVDSSAAADNFSIIGFGQIGIPQYRNLQKVSFKSFFPGNTNDPYTNAEAQRPKYYVDLLKAALENAEVGRLVIKRPGKDNLNIRAMIKSFKTTDKGGQLRDIDYQIELSEYRAYKPEKVVVKTKKKKTADGKEKVVKTAAKKKQRAVDTPVMRVGATVIANGTYCYDSYGSKPHGTAKNLTIEVKRIVPGREYPILIGSHGWIKESCLQIKS